MDDSPKIIVIGNVYDVYGNKAKEPPSRVWIAGQPFDVVKCETQVSGQFEMEVSPKFLKPTPRHPAL